MNNNSRRTLLWEIIPHLPMMSSMSEWVSGLWGEVELNPLIWEIAHERRAPVWGRERKWAKSGGSFFSQNRSWAPLIAHERRSLRTRCGCKATRMKSYTKKEAQRYLQNGKCIFPLDDSRVCDRAVKCTQGSLFNFYRHFFSQHPVKEVSNSMSM